MSRGIEVVIAWGDRILGVRTLRQGGTLGLGRLIGPLPVPGDALRAVPGPLVVHRSDGPRVVIPPDARGWVVQAGARRRSLDELRHQGHPFRSAPRPVFPPGTEVVLGSQTTVQLQLGMLGLRICRATDKAASLPGRGAPIDRRLAACCAAAGVSLLGALGASAAVMPPLSSSVELDELQGMDHISFLVMADDLLAEQQVASEHGLGPTDEAPVEPGDRCRCRGGGPMGCVDADPVSARYGVAGPIDNPDPHIARAWAKGEPHYEPLFAPWLDYPWADQAPVAPWGRDASLGTDPVSARGHLWGDTVGDAKGTDGMGSPSNRRGLTKVLTSDERRTDSPTRSPRVTHSGLRTVGPRKPSAVLRLVSARFPRLSACYASALATKADLGGRVVVSFQIDSSGATSHVAVRSQDIRDEPLRRCLAAAFTGVAFPSAATASTAVTYPLLLQP